MRNLLTDVPGILVGNARDARAATYEQGEEFGGLGWPQKISTEALAAAADCLARAVARGVYEATALPYKTAVPDWKTRFGGGRR